MVEEHTQRMRRTDDWIVRHWQIIAFLIAVIFFGGGWWQGSIVKAALNDQFQAKAEATFKDHETRITRIEDAVVYLKEIAEDGKRGKP